MTANSENVYCPVLLSAKPIGRKPRIVIRVPDQHGKGGGSIGEGSRLDFFHAFLDLGDHHFDGDHRIIHQEAERDDERAERDALQADAHRFHGDKDDGEHQRDRQGNHEPGPEAEAEEADSEHDDDRLEQRLGEFADGLAHDLGLVRHQVELNADGEALHQALGRLVQAFAESRDCCRPRAC